MGGAGRPTRRAADDPRRPRRPACSSARRPSAGDSSATAALTTATTAPPNVKATATRSTQNVQAPTQLGRNSDARENADESDPSSARWPALTNANENCAPGGRPVRTTWGSTGCDPWSENVLSAPDRHTRIGRAPTSFRSRAVHSPGVVVAVRCPVLSGVPVRASRTVTLTRAVPTTDCPQIATCRNGDGLVMGPWHSVRPGVRMRATSVWFGASRE